MNTLSKISIITPSYNQEQCIEQTICSVLVSIYWNPEIHYIKQLVVSMTRDTLQCIYKTRIYFSNLENLLLIK